MTIFVIILIVGYLAMTRVTATRYFARRHGVGWRQHDKGAHAAVWVGLLWPVSLFAASVQKPQLCNHPDHMLEHERLPAQAEELDAIRQRRAQGQA